MMRFSEHQTIDRLAKSSPLDADPVCGVGDAIAAVHGKAAPAPVEPRIQSIPLLAASIPRPIVDGLDDARRSAFAQIRDLLTQRDEKGYVRHCHGELHLGNIVVTERKPVLFDAIEFDPAIASTDVLTDLALPIMDFLHSQRPTVATVLLNRYT